MSQVMNECFPVDPGFNVAFRRQSRYPGYWISESFCIKDQGIIGFGKNDQRIILYLRKGHNRHHFSDTCFNKTHIIINGKP